MAVINRLTERGPRCFDGLLVQSHGIQPFFQGINKHLLGGAVFQLGDVNSLSRLLALWFYPGLQADVDLGHDKTVVCPTFCTAHGLGEPHILPVPLPGDDIVYPGCLVPGTEAKDGVGDQEVMLGTGLEEQEAVAVALACPMLAQHTFPGAAVTSHSCVEVTKNDELVRSWNSGDDSIEVFIKPVFGLIWVGHGGCIGADDGGKILSIGEGESHCREAIIHPFWGAGLLACSREML